VEGVSILDMIQQGWLATYPLIIFSMMTVSIIGERMWSLRNLVSESLGLANSICPTLEQGDFGSALQQTQDKIASPAGRIFSDVLSRHSSDSLEYLADLTEEKRFEELEALKGPLWILGTVSSSAPFIGLFGTVVGIVKAFHNMAVMGSGGFSVVAAGISEALVATALGLGVAIIAVIFYNYFQTRIERIEAALTIACNRVIDAIHLGRRGVANGAR
jgi:biopolymer transport protein ExbB/TolQ